MGWLVCLVNPGSLLEEATALLDDGHAEFSVDSGELNHVLERLVALDVRTMTTSPPTLEELFMRHYDNGVIVPGERTDVQVVFR